ncbi:MAG: glutathione S-transferase family protein [Burkholderiaceae bacterium]
MQALRGPCPGAERKHRLDALPRMLSAAHDVQPDTRQKSNMTTPISPTGITLYGNSESGHSNKVRLALVFGQVEHDYVHVDIFVPHEQRSEPFRSLARFNEVPLLVWGAESFVQSNAILCLLAERLKRMGGESPQRMARVREWLFWEANRLGLSLPHVRFARQFSPQEYASATQEWLLSRFLRDIARLEAELSDGRAFILDEQLSVADCALCGYLFWADEVGLTVPPHVRAWLHRIQQLPGWQPPRELLAATL